MASCLSSMILGGFGVHSSLWCRRCVEKHVESGLAVLMVQTDRVSRGRVTTCRLRQHYFPCHRGATACPQCPSRFSAQPAPSLSFDQSLFKPPSRCSHSIPRCAVVLSSPFLTSAPSQVLDKPSHVPPDPQAVKPKNTPSIPSQPLLL